eukprot:NODE_2825_length_1033_cov_6.313008_g2364_i0.p4 GENE.NODE_2825_length_1033_cov_6.313008_g2364_i0~~NODE_2825_length_1033_cov_6.313008_g2364_i0.p4  ORF type:complete len:75 (+),score=7.10 NODE_2825_length_1033_cov_6.313008_g2364_i0:202-426(+)
MADWPSRPDHFWSKMTKSGVGRRPTGPGLQALQGLEGTPQGLQAFAGQLEQSSSWQPAILLDSWRAKAVWAVFY